MGNTCGKAVGVEVEIAGADPNLLLDGSLVTVDVGGKKPFARTAVLMIGYQHDYFGADGKLHKVIEASSQKVLNNTIKIIEELRGSSVLFVETPIIFTKDYSELVEPSGILKVIQDVGAFKSGEAGAETIPELKKHGDRILQIPGKRGLNAFTGTCLEHLLKSEGVTDVVLCGAVTSVCIDSTGRAAHERGFRVHQLSDCTCGRTEAEQEQYCNSVFPLYSNVTITETILQDLKSAEAGRSYTPPLTLAALQSNQLTTAEVAGKRPFAHTAVIMIGYQHDYFGADGKLHKVIEASASKVFNNTIKLIEALKETSVTMVETPIVFTQDYGELVEPSGILKIIKDVGAFRSGGLGAETIPELKKYGNRILQIPGKRGLNAFTGTCLDGLLKMERVTDVVLCGAVTSVCIDSTGRAAHERGFRVHQLSDCTCGRTEAEQSHYCKDVFPLYADVTTTDDVISRIKAAVQVGPAAAVTAQDQLTAMNAQAGEKYDRQTSGVDEAAYQRFERVCEPPLILEWMRRHPRHATQIRERQDELALQITHGLVDFAACATKNFQTLEAQVAAGEVTIMDLDEDPQAPLVSFLSHGKDEAGSMCRLLKLMLRQLLHLHCTSDAKHGRLARSTPRIFLDSDDIYSQSELRASVEECKSIVLVLTKTAFFRPWVICEFITAWRLGIPIIPVEVAGSGFQATPQNIRELLSESVSDSALSLAAQYCPNLNRQQLEACCKSILGSKRVVIEPGASTSSQWASILDLARLLKGPSVEMGQDYTLELVTQDPMRSFVPQAQADQDYTAFISYHHTQDNQVVARIVKMMLESRGGPEDSISVFLDADSLFDMDTLVSHIHRSKNMLVLLSAETFTRPFVIVEMVSALRHGIPLIPVPIVKDFNFRQYVGSDKFADELVSSMDDRSQQLFRENRIRAPEIARAIKSLFNVIAQPFYGHSSESVQKAQVFEIQRRLTASGTAKLESPRKRPSASLKDLHHWRSSGSSASSSSLTHIVAEM
jgi:nicotinamidase-related amidase